MTPEAVRIEAPHFVAAVDLGRDGCVVHAAPILAYMRGWPLARVLSYARSRKWRTTLIELPLSQRAP